MRSDTLTKVTVPATLASELRRFRRALVARCFSESIVWCVVVALSAFWLLFLIDRTVDTPPLARAGLASGVLGTFVWTILRVIRLLISSMGFVPTARIIRERSMLFGDHLVGALELAESRHEQQRSHVLCQAALDQVADEAERKDWRTFLPQTRISLASVIALTLMVPAGLLAAISPSAVAATQRRLTLPLSSVERFTFARFETLPDSIVIAHGEPFKLELRVAKDAHWRPSRAVLELADTKWTAVRDGDSRRYQFELPALIESSFAFVRAGDATVEIQIEPQLRPELTRIEGVVDLPSYLESLDASQIRVDLRGNVLEVVEGCAVTIEATASRRLAFASVNGRPVKVQGSSLSFSLAQAEQDLLLRWSDIHGLEAKQPLAIPIKIRPDRKPSLIVESKGLPSRILQNQQVAFRVFAEDDFSVARVGMEWILGDNRSFGRHVIGGGGDRLELDALFQPSSFNVEPGELSLRFWAIDDFPDRDPVYTEPITLELLSESEHAVWVRDEFDRWRQSALDVRDRELGLFERNRELAAIPKERRDKAWKEQLREQARAETRNALLLDQLTQRGEDLLRQAARNSEVESAYVETLADTIQRLQELSRDRMQNIASSLREASEESLFEEMADPESTQSDLSSQVNQRDEGGNSDDQRERLGLAGTTIVDTSGQGSDQQSQNPDEKDELLDALEDQEKLVAAFDTIADEMQQLLGRMEGSTLVKRLKAISRIQDRVASELAQSLEEVFGRTAKETRERLAFIDELMQDTSEKARTVVDDLEAFLGRREIEHYEAVSKEIKTFDLLNRLAEMRESLPESPGASISAAEYWADNLDRWADDLVHPGKKSPNEQGKKKLKSLPPDVILHVLRVLESEVNLREQTRVAEQGRKAMSRDEYMAEGIRLSEQQDLIRDQLDQLVEKLDAQPDAALHFGAEIEILSLAVSAMVDATKTLVSPDTGPDAIAAETEAIELMLRSKKVDPDGGASSGGEAVGGAGGDTDEAAVALLGRGLDELSQERESETRFAVGRNQNEVPEPWLEGLQQYHERLEQIRAENGGPE